MVKDIRLAEIMTLAFQQKPAESAESISRHITEMLGWESFSYVHAVLCGEQTANSITDLQRIYWAIGRLCFKPQTAEIPN